MKTILLIIFSFITLNAQSRIIPFSTNPAPSTGTAHYTDSLKYYGIVSSLANGSVDLWEDEIISFDLIPEGADTSKRPIKSGNDIFFGVGDVLTSDVAPISFNASPITIEIVLDVSDSATGDLFTIRGTDLLAFSFQGSRFCAAAYDGATEYFYNGWSLPFMGRHHIVATWDGSSAPDVYLDGVLAPAIASPYLGLYASTNSLKVGGEGGSAQAFSIPLYRVYKLELTAQQVEDNYNSTSVQGLLP